MAVKRIVDHSEQFNLNGSEYMIIDSDENGTKKYKLSNLQTGGSGGRGGSAYDAEIRLYHDGNSGHSMQVIRQSGDYATLKSLIDQNITPNVLVREFHEGLHIYGCTSAIAIYDVIDDVNPPFIWFKAYIPYGTANPKDWSVIGLTWNANDVVTID